VALKRDSLACGGDADDPRPLLKQERVGNLCLRPGDELVAEVADELQLGITLRDFQCSGKLRALVGRKPPQSLRSYASTISRAR
jgi:hypothetical protein